MSDARKPIADGCAVAVVDDRLGEVVPAGLVPALRTATLVYADHGLAPATRAALDAAAAPSPEELLSQAANESVVLVAPEAGSARAAALLEAGAQRIGDSAPPGVELLDAVTVMDRLRSPGGCPWDAEQTHVSLRQYLVEETYELLDALERDDRTALREELGDVLLQVLFHARVAAEDTGDPFDIDVVAAGLVSKLVSRHPHVFAGGETVHDAQSQQLRWEELKQLEKSRDSVLDGVALGQPAVALAAKLAQRADRAGVPDDLFPVEHRGAGLFGIAARMKTSGSDPEDELRATALAFEAELREAESRARSAGLDPARLRAEQWRALWPYPSAEATRRHSNGIDYPQ